MKSGAAAAKHVESAFRHQPARGRLLTALARMNEAFPAYPGIRHGRAPQWAHAHPAASSRLSCARWQRLMPGCSPAGKRRRSAGPSLCPRTACDRAALGRGPAGEARAAPGAGVERRGHAPVRVIDTVWEAEGYAQSRVSPGEIRLSSSFAGARRRDDGALARGRHVSADPRVTTAIAHWAPRFVANGVPLADFEEVTAGIARWDDWCAAWSAPVLPRTRGWARKRSPSKHRLSAAAHLHARRGLLSLREIRLRARLRARCGRLTARPSRAADAALPSSRSTRRARRDPARGDASLRHPAQTPRAWRARRSW